jgi:glucose/mannose-6-phosphate isomerase
MSMSKPNQHPESGGDFCCTDPGDMLGRINDFPRQIRDAWHQASRLSLPGDLGETVDQVVITGMGGSAIGGDLVAGLVADRCAVPVTVHRSYGVPAWVDRSTLVIASSYSGGTEETLSAWDAAGEAGARRIAVTTGGELGKRAVASDDPLLEFAYDAPPRAALGYSFTLILGILARLELIADPGRELEAGVALLESAGPTWQPDVPEDHNPAKQLARRFQNSLPVIFGADHLVFATDYPFGPDEGRAFMADTIRSIEDVSISDTDRERVFSGNIKRLVDL